MSSLLLPVLVRGRPAFRRLLTLSTPCLSKRLGSSRNLGASGVPLRSSSSGSASAFPARVQPHSKSDPEPDAGSTSSPVEDEHTVSPRSGLQFEEQEKKYYHHIMETLPQYRETIFTSTDLDDLKYALLCDVSELPELNDWSKSSNKEIVDAFRLMTAYALKHKLVISDPRFDHICCAIRKQINSFSDEEVLEIGKLHMLWHFPETAKEKNYKLLFESFDTTCVTRYQKKWFESRDMTTILRAADVVYWQRLGSKSHFLKCMIYHLGLKAKKPQHMIQLMFYLGIIRSVPASYKFYDLERKVFSFVEECSLEELAIVVNSLFRSKSRIQYYPLMQELLIKSLKTSSTIDDYLLTTISKGVNLAPRELRPLVALLQKRIFQRIQDFSNESIIHALWMFASNNVVDEDFAQGVYERTLNDIGNLRTKELTRVITVFTEYVSPNRNLKKLAECIFEELRKPEKSYWFRRLVFVQGATLHRLLICGVCPNDFLDQYMSSMTSAEVANEALGVDVHLEVFYPDYNGARLHPPIREAVFKQRFQNDSEKFVKSSGAKGKFSTFNLRSVELAKKVLLDVLGDKEEYLLVKRVIPSSGYIDVLLHISKDGRYLPIPPEMRRSEPWELTRIPAGTIEGDKFIAITFLTTSSEFSDRKIRWLQRERAAIFKSLGFIHMEVGLEYWINNTNFDFKKTDLLRRIAEVLPE